MGSWKEVWNAKFKRRLIVPVMAAVMALSLGTYELTRPTKAEAAAAPAAAPLNEETVAPLMALNHAMETLAARVTPAVVNVTVTSKTKDQMTGNTDMQRFFGPDSPFGNSSPFGFNMPNQPQSRIEHGLGSGVIISPDGYIVTNDHVVDGAVDIRVTMSDRRILPAKLVGADPLTDLAVLKIDGTNLPNVPLGNSESLHPGETVLAFGNPFGFRFTVTRGIISALNRPNPSTDDRRKPGEFIQTDAAINPGNSGGPLVNVRGEVIGINTFLISPSGTFSGMGFAIPTQIVKPTVTSLIRDGKVSHGYMGIGITDVTPDNARFFHVDNASGAVISQVEPDSPGAKAGLKIGDVITGVNGKDVADAGQLQVEVGQTSPGTTVKLNIMRDGKSMTLPVTLEAMGKRDETESASSEQGKPRWGVGLGDLTPSVRQQIDAPADLNGAVVENVQPGSPADNASLQRGDVIVQVDRKPMQSASDVVSALKNVPKGQDTLLLIWSNGGNTFRVLHPTQG